MAKFDEFTGSDMYILDDDLSKAFLIARILGKPLLLEGEPGTGKTKLAQEYALHTGLPIYEFPVTSESKVAHLVSSFDDVLRLMDSQAVIANAQMEQAGLKPKLDLNGREIDNLDDYVRLGPLAKSYQTPNSVLLIDEIDKAPREFPNNLLYVLNDRKAVIPETGEVIETTLETMPSIVITSNHEQDLPAPFIRRCVYHYIEFPNPARMREILRLHHPDANQTMVESAIVIFYQLRDLGMLRKPSTSEIIDWLSYLKRDDNISANDLEHLVGYQTLVKHKDDLPILESIKENGINNLSRSRNKKRF
ncbi:MAG: MoxR family ATPase [Proteobacteria bacterium]|nr:MoxR family ATPase [Pseudomonadota bacterium]